MKPTYLRDYLKVLNKCNEITDYSLLRKKTFLFYISSLSLQFEIESLTTSGFKDIRIRNLQFELINFFDILFHIDIYFHSGPKNSERPCLIYMFGLLFIYIYRGVECLQQDSKYRMRRIKSLNYMPNPIQIQLMFFHLDIYRLFLSSKLNLFMQINQNWYRICSILFQKWPQNQNEWKKADT